MKGKSWWVMAVAATVLATGWAVAEETNAAAELFPLLKTDGITFKMGADERIRQENFNDIPIVADPPGVTRGGHNSYIRYRTRVYEDIVFSEETMIKMRLVNEIRTWIDPTSSKKQPYEAPDETVVDLLFLDLKNFLGMPVDVRIGRQELIYGTGKVILEGTPKDGSRTIYMDAAKISLRPIPNTTIDLLGIYNQPENHLAFSSEHRDLTGYDSGYNDVTESGGGVYAMNKSVERLPFEAYYLYKNESDWDNSKGEPQPERDVHTFGARIMPVIVKDRVVGNLEAAYQTGELGEEDCEGSMVDGSVSYFVPVAEAMKPKLSAGVYWLSGDDPNTAKDEGWNPLWARYPQYSELYVYAFDAEAAGRWSNVLMPYLDLSIMPVKAVKVAALAGQMMADEKNGPGEGDTRGQLYTIRTDFTLAQNKLIQNDKVSGHVILELFDPDDYYNVTETAYFFRWEICYAF